MIFFVSQLKSQFKPEIKTFSFLSSLWNEPFDLSSEKCNFDKFIII